MRRKGRKSEAPVYNPHRPQAGLTGCEAPGYIATGGRAVQPGPVYNLHRPLAVFPLRIQLPPAAREVLISRF